MENAEATLVIILSITLTIFLIVAIIVFVALYKLIVKIREIADKAEVVAGNVVSATDTFKKAAGPLAVGKFIANIVGILSKKKGK
jgi:predicted secreted protein